MKARPTPGARRFERWALGLVVAAIVLLLLVGARFFLIPLAMAILLFSLTGAAIDRIADIRFGSFAVPSWLASVVAFALIAAVLIVVAGFVTTQIDVLVSSIPAYVQLGEMAVARLFNLLGDEVARGVLGAFEEINIGSWLRLAAGSAGNLMTTTVLVILYVGFLFAEKPWFDAKLQRLFPPGERAREVGEVIASIRRSVHHYLLVKTGVSALTGVIVYAILWTFELNFAEALGVLTFLLNFIPTIGSVVATALPLLVALVQFETWPPVIALFACVGVVQFTLGNVLDPMLMGRTLQMSSFAIVLSLTLWGAIWGVVGMFLAVPIMVMAMIVCAHVPALRPVAILLSRDGAPLPEQAAKRDRDQPPRLS